jgi:hypothetical protein
MSDHRRDWREICAEVLSARDSERVDGLLEELLQVLEERKRMQRHDPSNLLT